ncbi:hypothetical protein ACO0LO_22405 [Undibacterium sp. TJN25]|uniref:hypothetical protein n=1 Tax=Undibacterium sp. TJN25 TaxID=3413056 RepID=UPI003BF0222A
MPSVSDAYLESRLKLMIVGKETRAWTGGLHRAAGFRDEQSYVEFSMQAHADFLLMQPQKHKFFQFYRQAVNAVAVTEPAAGNNAVWANLFCVSSNANSPTDLPAAIFRDIRDMSRALLLAQVDILKPDAILFVTGPGYDRYLKEFFAITDGIVHEPRALWSFRANGIPAFRTHHPQWEKGRQYRLRALQEILKPAPARVSIG